MQYIPPFLCQLIDATAFGGQVREFEQDWSHWKADFEQYFVNESDYTLSKEDAQVVENLPSLLSQLESSVSRAFAGQGQAQDLLKQALEFFEAHDSFFEEREKRYFVQNPPLDRLLKAAVAYMQDRAQAPAVLKRVPDAALGVESIHQLYLQSHEALPKEIVEGSVEGFKRAEKALNFLAQQEQSINKDTLDEMIFELKSAGELLSHIPGLFHRFEKERGCPIPLIGPVINVLREDDDDEQVIVLRESAWPAFLELWENRRDGWMLDPALAVDLLPEVEQTILHLSHILDIYPDEDEAFWETIEHMEELFEQIRDNAIHLAELPASSYWPEAQLLINLLRGGAPLFAAQTLAQGIKQGGNEVPPVIREVGKALESYLREPDPLPLLEALNLLVDEFELSKTSRVCSTCGARIELSALECSDCGVKVAEVSISG